MIWESFRITGSAVTQIFLLSAIGYFLAKKNILGKEGFDSLSRLVVEITLPILIFCQLIKDFDFDLYAKWWIFPCLSIAITIAGLFLGALFAVFLKGLQQKLQFLSLVAFQNSGYLPLVLAAALLPKDKADTMFIYLFLFLLGFNLVIWSFGAFMLSFHKSRRFDASSLFSPPVISVLLSLFIVFFNLNKLIPDAILKPLRLVGDCTLPLAMFVVGGSLASISLKQVNKKAVCFMVLAKLIILPLFGLWLIARFNLPELIGLLIIIQLAAPPATSLAVIAKRYEREDLLIGQGIFFGHLVSLVTLPVFLSLFFSLYMLK